MKKLLLASTIALFGMVSAQSAGFEGTAFVTGQVGFSSTKDNNDNAKSSTITVLPAMGTFISPNIAIGGALGVKSTTEESTNSLLTSTYKNTNTEFIVMPMVRKYWGLGDKLYIFGQVDAPLAWGKQKNESTGNTSTETKYSSWGLNVRPGLDFFVSKNWTFEATVGSVGFKSVKPEGGKSTDTFDFGVNLSSITFGVKYLFK